MSALMGIDIGTGSAKVDLLDNQGRAWSASSAAYGISSPRPGWAEQDPEAWWRAALEAVTDVWAQAGLPAGTGLTVGFTGQMHSSVLLDSMKRPVRPAILWCDSRAADQARVLGEEIPEMANVTGNAPLAAFTLAHLLWLRENEPETLERARHLMLPKDYLRHRLTGVVATDWTDASGTNMLDVRTREWSTDILDAAGVNRRLLPEVTSPDTVIGPVRGPFPFTPKAVAVTGLGDEFAESVAAGVIEPGPLVIVLGTSGALLSVRDTPSEGVFCHAQSDRWLRLDSLHSAGMSLTWLRDVVAPGTPLNVLTEEAAAVPVGAEGLIYLPFLVGERSGQGRERSAGFLGAQARHTRAHFVRAVLEGVAMELKRISIERMGITRPSSIVIMGGGAKSRLWSLIVAEVFGAPLSATTRSAAAGALDVAGVAAGWWTYAQAATRANHLPLEPSTRAVQSYAEHFARYLDLVHAVERQGPLAG